MFDSPIFRTHPNHGPWSGTTCRGIMEFILVSVWHLWRSKTVSPSTSLGVGQSYVDDLCPATWEIQFENDLRSDFHRLISRSNQCMTLKSVTPKHYSPKWDLAMWQHHRPAPWLLPCKLTWSYLIPPVQQTWFMVISERDSSESLRWVFCGPWWSYNIFQAGVQIYDST